MKYEQLSITEYADLRGITRQAVLKAIYKGHNLKGVINYKKIGNAYALKCDKDEIILLEKQRVRK